MTLKVVTPPSDSAPSHLSPEAQRWFKALVHEYSIDDPAGLLLLMTAFESFDRAQAARRAIEAEGMVTRGSQRQRRAHPLLGVERDARASMLAALKALSLDVEPLKTRPGRPAGAFYPGRS